MKDAQNNVSAIPGLPSADQLREWQIWDSYFTPAFGHPGRDGSEKIASDLERALPALQLGRFQKACLFAHVGIGTTNDADFERLVQQQPELVLNVFRKWPDLLLGMVQVNPERVLDSQAAIRQWLKHGPMLGVYFRGSRPGALNCRHPNVRKLVATVQQVGGLIMQHTWLRSDQQPAAETSTPMDLAELAASFPDQAFICAHAGGEWEQGLRAVRDVPNVYVETSGFDATAGFIEMAVREVGSDRIIFGSHLPSRSLGTELSKVTAARISDADKQKILGENYRRLLQPFLERRKRL